MNKVPFIFIFAMVILAIAVSAEQCNETWAPCGGGCTATDMSGMFSGVYNFDATIGNISGWDTSCVTNMAHMFENSDFNQDISKWNTGQVTDMQWMFSSAQQFDQPIGNWDTHSVTNMYAMFGAAYSFNQDLDGWDTSSVTNMGSMFKLAWVKVKKENEMDCIVDGASEGKGPREGYFGHLRCFHPIRGKLTHVGDVGTGFNEDDLKEVCGLLRQKKPFVITVKYMQLSKDNHMRFPVFVRLRKDLTPRDVMKK